MIAANKYCLIHDTNGILQAGKEYDSISHLSYFDVKHTIHQQQHN
jgi:hypothetical protein